MKRKYTKKASPSFSPYPYPVVKQSDETPRQRPTSSVRNANTVKTNVKQAPAEKEDYIIKRSTEAALIYDELAADFDVAAAFKGAEEWIPTFDSFNRKPSVRVQWRGHPLKIKHMPYYDRLHRDEASIAATLRLTPEQYLKCKWALILAAKNAYETKSLFRKSEAQKVCCIDVNKTSVLWNAFGKLGWLGPMWPQ
ncbi:uncharacterized protein B0P05DRAFT_474045 [Gilbertella persicaria]|nr:uncharacterized protein B0P05DRAFT_474045 [Gilbertella persicaria]KAI8071099.1 hypothetical protein B0P05DRAFT_474045 [Gilbertella persicaria]